MEKDSFWNQLISAIAGLGIPGLVLLVVMSSTGFAGAAALTTALATLGGPLGMMGGIAVLGVLSMMSKGLAAYGLDAVFNAVIDELAKKGMAKEKISEAIMSYPIPSYLKKQLKGRIEFTKTTSKESASVMRRIFRTGSLDLECGNVLELRELHSVASEEIQIVSKLAEGLWEGKISSIDGQTEIAQIIFMQTALREFVSTSLNLCIGHIYKLKEDGSQNWLNVQVEVEVAKGFWLGVIIKADSEEDEIVNIIYRKI